MTETEATDLAERVRDIHRIMVKIDLVLDALLNHPFIRRWIKL